MKHSLEILYATSNFKKFEFLKTLLYKKTDIQINWMNSKSFKVNETNDAKRNAQIKSVEASKKINGLVLSSDDNLTFLNPELSHKSGALIYRNISTERNSALIIKHYIDLIKKSNNKTINTILTSYFAFSMNGNMINTFEYSYEMTLRIPEQAKLIDDMPLSMLHFLQEKNKFYFELSIDEQIEYHNPLLRIFCDNVENVKKNSR